MKRIQNTLPAILVTALFIFVLTGTSQAQKSMVEDQIKTAETDTTKAETDTTKAETCTTKTETCTTKTEKKNIVEFDFKEKKIKPPGKMKFHDFYIVKIKNINLNLYDVKVNNKDSTLTPGVKFPTFESIALDGLSGLAESLPSLNILSTLPIAEMDTIKEKMKNKFYYLNLINIKLNAISRNIDSLALSVQTFSLSYLALNDSLKNELKKDFSYQKILEESEKYRNEVNRISKNLITSEKEYRNFIDNHREIDSTLIKLDKEIKELYAKTAGNVDKVFAGVNAEKVGEWLSTLIHRENNSTGVYTSQPFQFTGDIAELTVSIIPKSADYGLPSFVNTYKLPKPSSFYIGGGGSFYYSPNMSNDAYSISSVKIDSVTTEYTLVDEEQPRGEIGISSVIQFGWSFGDNRRGNVHLSIGPAASIGKTIKPRLLTGIGIGYGRKQKVTLSYGALMGQANRLSKTLKPGTVGNEKPDQVMVSEFKIRGAFSIGYIFNF